MEHLQHMLNMEEQEHRDPPTQNSDEGSRSPLKFLPLDFESGGRSENSHPTVGQYLTRDQTRHIYKKVEIWGICKCSYDATGGRRRKTIEQSR